MSVPETHRRYGSPSDSAPSYQYAPLPDASRGGRVLLPHPPGNPPLLPPMAALLSRPEQPLQYPPPHSFQPQNNKMNHPLELSEMHPSAPVHHIFEPSVKDQGISQHRIGPLLVPYHPEQGLRAPVEHGKPPRRQIKKISQRREEREKDYVRVDKSNTALRNRLDEPEPSFRSHPQEPPNYQPIALPSVLARPEASSPQNVENQAVPIPTLAATSRYVDQSSQIQRILTS